MSDGLRDVRADSQRLAAGPPNLLGHGLEPVESSRADRHRRPVAREPQGRGASDASGRAGDGDDESRLV